MIPSSQLGPPRLVQGMSAIREEQARQAFLIASGDLRSLYTRKWGRCTVGWQEVETEDGVRWFWCSDSHQWSGAWPNRGDREAAWKAALEKAGGGR